MKTITLSVFLFVAVGLWGCGSGSGTAPNTASTVPNKVNPVSPSNADPNSTNPADQPMAAQGDNVQTNAPIVNSPDQTTPGGAYRIAPKDPNDPHFKPDPKLGGG